MRRALPLLAFAVLVGFVLGHGETLHVPEDYPTIQAAIDASQARDVIFIAAGTYSEDLEIKTSLAVQGDGSDNTRIQGGIRVGLSGQDTRLSVRIVGLMITGARDGVSTWGEVDLQLGDIVVSRHEWYGIELSGSAHAELRGCTISDNLYGISVTDSASLAASDCAISGNRRDGISVAGSACAVVTQCAISENTPGIDLQDRTSATITDSTISGNAYAVKLRGSADAEVRRCSLSENAPGIKLYDSSRATVADCTISSFGIELSDSAQVEATGCAIIQGTAGILLYDTSQATVTACTISERSSGIQLRDASRATVTDCSLTQNSYGVILRDSGQASISRSSITENTYGIKLWDSSRAEIADSRISRGNWDGIVLHESASAEMWRNTVEENPGWGVRSFSSGEVLGSDNTLRNNGIDLCGNVPNTLRLPLAEAAETEVTYPDPVYKTLQEAVDAVLDGGTLVLRSGEYTAGVTIGKPIHIRASHDEDVVLVARNDANPVISLIAGARATLTHVTITGGDVGICLGGNAQAQIHDCTISGNDTDGVVLSDSAQAAIHDTEISHHWDDGLQLSDLAQATVHGCVISVNGNGIELVGSAYAEITSCTSSGNEWTGITLSEASRITISDSSILVNGNGVELSDSARSEVSECAVSNNAYGVVARESACAEITGSKISGNSVGIDLHGSCQVELWRNEITANTGVGISSSSTQQAVGLANVMSGNGIDLVGNTPGSLRLPLAAATEEEVVYPGGQHASLQEAIDALLPGGTLVLRPGAYDAGITIAKQICVVALEAGEVTLSAPSERSSVVSLLDGAEVRLTGLGLVGGDTGICAAASSSVEIISCSISEAFWGIALRDASHAKIEGSRLASNTHGISLWDTSDVEISNSELTGNAATGITLFDSARAQVMESLISRNADGIVVTRTAELAVIDSDVSENTRVGIGLKYSAQATITRCVIAKNGQYGIEAEFREWEDMVVAGSGNLIPGPEDPDPNGTAPLSPGYPGDPWPIGFLRESST